MQTVKIVTLNTLSFYTAVFLAIAPLSSLNAAAQASGTMEKGPGAQSCATFAQQYKQFPKEIESDYFSWAQGFMSGLNDLSVLNPKPYQIGPRDLDSKSLEEQKSIIRDYCEEHPLAEYSVATLEVYKSLSRLPQGADDIGK